MSKVPNPGQPDPRGDLIEEAVRAICAFGVDKSRETAETLLSMWTRRDELTARERIQVLDVFGGPRLTTDVSCTKWCIVDHGEVYEDYYRTCVSTSVTVPILDPEGRPDRGRQLEVCLNRSVLLETQEVCEAIVMVGDEHVSLADAVQLADGLLVTAAVGRAGSVEPVAESVGKAVPGVTTIGGALGL